MKITRIKKKQREVFWRSGRPERTWPCPNCHQTISSPGHFVPPGAGDPGFWTCDPIVAPELPETYAQIQS